MRTIAKVNFALILLSLLSPKFRSKKAIVAVMIKYRDFIDKDFITKDFRRKKRRDFGVEYRKYNK